MTKILVYGYYSHNNIGDDLFIEAFCHLFPNNNFIFTDNINEEDLREVEVIFFGGGSFLDCPPNITAQALQTIKDKKIFYLGVGIETNIDPVHLILMKQAKLIAPRNNSKLKELKELKQINSNVLSIPDLIYSLPIPSPLYKKKSNSVLILPNISTVPKWNDPHWKHVAWEYFKSEFSQFLDHLIDQKYNISFFPMCQDSEADDAWAAFEIINKMSYRGKSSLLIDNKKDFESLVNLFSEYSMVITQRFHGIILADVSQTPCLTIHHHDKLKSIPNEEGLISFYETSKSKLISKFNQLSKTEYSSLPIETNIFNVLIQQVKTLLDN